MILKDYKLKLNLKSACNYEYMMGKPYGSIGNEFEILTLAYCILLSNNDIDFTFETFLGLMRQKKVANEVSNAINRLIEVQGQFKPRKKTNQEDGEGKEGEGKEVWMSDLADYLIVNCSLDPHYIMYEMDLYEIEGLVESTLDKKKGDLVEKRLFAFLEMSPLKMPKNCKGPEDILPFAWEAEVKKKKLNEEEAKVAFNFLRPKEEIKKDG